MGNHQFGLVQRPPDLFGRGWAFVKEKRRPNKEKATRSAPTLAAEPLLRRPNSTMSFLKLRFAEMHRDGLGETADGGGHLTASLIQSAAAGVVSSGTPKAVKRTASVRRTRSMQRCSPTVPDSVTLTLGMVNNVVIGASGVTAAATAGVANPGAVANALDALQKLTPAAPQLGKEPSFDHFFEEAERRNQTMEALQAALTAPPSSVASFGAQGQVPLLDRVSSSSNLPSPTKENEPFESRPPPVAVQSTPPPSRKRSPVPSLARLGSRSRDNFCQVSCATGTDDEEDALLPSSGNYKDTLPTPTKGRVLIIVGSCDQDSFDDDRWDRFPPTIIVQPERTSASLFPPAISSSSSSSCLTTAGIPGPGSTPRSVRRRGSFNPAASASSVSSPLGVRFADELVSSVRTPLPSSPKKDAAESVQLREECVARRLKRRSSLRRKTIGGITSFSCPSDGTTAVLQLAESGVPSRTLDDTAAAAMSVAGRSGNQQQRSPARPLSKKSLSKSEIAQSRPLISLLTQPQINLIRQLWQQLYVTKGPTVLGNHIFQKAAFKNPHVREIFRTVDIGNQCFNVDIMCKSHAKALAAVLDDVLRNLENLDVVDAKLMEVGRQHAVFHDLGFQLSFWSVFAEAFIDCTLEWGEKSKRVEEVRKAWAIIVAYITDKMKLGYQEARRNLPRGCSGGRRIRVSDGSETESATGGAASVALVRSDSH